MKWVKGVEGMEEGGGGGGQGDQRWGSLAGETLLGCLQEKVTSQEISWPGEFDLVYLLL